MSDEVVDRVSKILEDHFWRDDHEGTEEGQRLYIKTAARLVIEELREPTQEMLDCRDAFMSLESARAMWHTMIDAASGRMK